MIFESPVNETESLLYLMVSVFVNEQKIIIMVLKQFITQLSSTN